jgi:hypothetical protein
MLSWFLPSTTTNPFRRFFSQTGKTRTKKKKKKKNQNQNQKQQKKQNKT